MRRKNRWAAAAAAGVAVGLVLAGCGAGDGGQSGGGGGSMTLLSEWTDGGSATSIQSTIDSWNKANPNNKMSQRSIGNEDFATASRTAMSGDNPPDVLQYEGFSDTADYAKAGKLVDLTDWWNTNKSRFALADSPGVTRACTYQGKVYCVPMSANAQSVLFYNAKLLADNGIAPPKTYDDVVAAGEKLKAKGITPIALGDKDGWPGAQLWMTFAAQLCGTTASDQAVDRKGPKWTDQCFTDAAAKVADLRQRGFFPKGVVSDDYNGMVSLFESGKAAFISTGSWFIGSWQDAPPPFQVGAEYFPPVTGAPFPDDKVAYGGDVIGIPTAGKNRAEAMKFLDYMTSLDQAKVWAKNYYFSAVKGAVAATGPANIRDLYDQTTAAQNTLGSLDLQLPPAVGEDVLYNSFQSLLNGKTTPQQFTAALEKSAQSTQGPSQQ
jgi:raffinose/stachyose/melibiose transport system substrate-binding protein